MVAIVLVGGVFEGSSDAIALGRVVVYQVSNLENLAISSFDQLKPGFGIDTLPFA
jgi:hypothetical protein